MSLIYDHWPYTINQNGISRSFYDPVTGISKKYHSQEHLRQTVSTLDRFDENYHTVHWESWKMKVSVMIFHAGPDIFL